MSNKKSVRAAVAAAVEAAPLAPPSRESIQLVLNNAYSAQQPNCDAAMRTVAAIREVDAFFTALLGPAPQSKSQGADSPPVPPTTPQASANSAGN